MFPYLGPGLATRFRDFYRLPVQDEQHREHSASAPSTQMYKVTETAVEVRQTVQECTQETQYRKVKSLKECFYGYYLKNTLKPIAPPCLLQVPGFIYSTHQSHQTPLRSQDFRFLPCSVCQAKEKKQRLVLFLRKKASAGIS